MSAPCDVSESLVDGNSLDEWGEVIEHVDRSIAQPLVIVEMTADKDQPWTQFSGAPPGHAAADTKRFGFVGRGEHDTATNSDGFSAQGRVEHLLNRCIERIEIRVQDGSSHCHPDPGRLLD
jgi:hypothetical protein